MTMRYDGLIEIATATELNNIRHDLDGTHYDEDEEDDGTDNIGSNAGCPTTNPVGCKGYELADDIDLSSFTNFAPIGSDSNPFTAILEGNDYTISDLNIATDTTYYTGFFAVLGRGSKVQNLSFAKSTTGSVASSNNSGSNSNPNYVGVLAGRNNGTISGVSVMGLSVSAGTGNYDNVGGLVGKNSGTIQNSSATGFAKGGAGGSDNVGGLVGYNFGTIGNSHATGKADGGDGNLDYVGGLVGFNLGTIGNSHAIGKADGGDGHYDFVGGLVGDNSGTIRSTAMPLALPMAVLVMTMWVAW